jgi:RecJ-like exonuclease
MSAVTVTKTHYSRHSDREFEVVFPARYEVCDRCDGKGTHTNPAIDGNGISPEEFREDPDFEEAYFRGDYDVSCSVCHGQRVVAVVDEPRLKGRKALLWKVIEQREMDDSRERSMERQIMFMENGGRW